MSAEEEHEETTDQEESGGKGGGGMKILLIFGVLFLLSNAVWGAIFFLQGDSGNAEAAEAKATTETALAEQQAKELELSKPGPIVALEPFVVNLDEPSGAHYLRVTVKIEIDREETRPAIDERLIMLRDQYITILSSKRLAQLRTQEDKTKLRQELLAVSQKLISERAVRAVYFTEFLTQ